MEMWPAARLMRRRGTKRGDTFLGPWVGGLLGPRFGGEGWGYSHLYRRRGMCRRCPRDCRFRSRCRRPGVSVSLDSVMLGMK